MMYRFRTHYIHVKVLHVLENIFMLNAKETKRVLTLYVQNGHMLRWVSMEVTKKLKFLC